MKKTAAILFALMMLLSSVSLAETLDSDSSYDELTVGVVTAPAGGFFTDAFGTNTTDEDIRDLLHGYNLMYWSDKSGSYVTDPTVVSGTVITEDTETGDRTYTIALRDGLCYSDGSRITVWDYAFSVLLTASPEMAELGYANNAYDYLAGAQAYSLGNAETIAGVQVKNDLLLSVTISGAWEPNFFELSLLNIQPYPISVIAPGCAVADDGNGVYLQGDFTADLLRQTLLDPETGYVSHPSVVSGPYTLVSYDAAAGTASFQVNPYYKGNPEGETPEISRIHVRTVASGDAVSLLASGEIGLVHKLMESEAVTKGLQNSASSAYFVQNYLRTGLSMISFCAERSTVAETAVRQAIACCLDKDSLITALTGDYGLGVDGYYGLGQWQYQLASGTITPAEGTLTEAQQKTFDTLNLSGLKLYSLDIQRAAELLNGAGWKLNADGVRAKVVNGEEVTLELTLVCFEGDDIADALRNALTDNLASVGIRLTVEPVSAERLMRLYYRQETRECDMIFVGNNFNRVYDPSVNYALTDTDQGVNNRTGVLDEKLYQLAAGLNQTKSGDLVTYLQKWVAFEEYWTEVLPAVPVYSNVYFDFYTSNLQNYDISSSQTWAQAIVSAYLSDYTDAQAEEGNEDFAFE